MEVCQADCRILRITSAEDVLFAGLEVSKSTLARENLERLALQAGLQVVELRKGSEELSSLDLPAIAWSADGKSPRAHIGV